MDAYADVDPAMSVSTTLPAALDRLPGTLDRLPGTLDLAPLSGLAQSIYSDVPWGVVIVLLIIALVILATIWMVTGSSGGD